MKILISGASVAGPVLAYWLHRYGFEPTIVERTPALRHGLGGHAVDLFGLGAEVARRMGRWDAIEAARTRIESLTLERFDKLKYAVAVLLVFIGAKMLAHEYIEISHVVSLLVIAGILAVGVVVSMMFPGKPAESADPER